MKSLFNLLTAIFGILMVVCILVQSQGASLGVTFGGQSNSFRSKRGAERLIYNATIIFAVIFVISVILSALSKR